MSYISPNGSKTDAEFAICKTMNYNGLWAHRTNRLFLRLIIRNNYQFRRKRCNILSINILDAEKRPLGGMFFVALPPQMIYPNFVGKKKQHILV